MISDQYKALNPSLMARYGFNVLCRRFYHYNRNFNQLIEEYKQLNVNRVFIIEKLTKYDIEIKNGYTPEQILHRFPLAFCTHITHTKIMSALIKLLTTKYKIHSTVIKAQTRGLTAFDENSAFPPDAVISAGGDGTFLEAASFIPPRVKGSRGFWVFGVNTDPERSLGTLCISYKSQQKSDSTQQSKLPIKFVDLNYGFADKSLMSEVTEFCNLDKFEFSHNDRYQPGSPQSAMTFDNVEFTHNKTYNTTLVKSPISVDKFLELTTVEYVDSILNNLFIAKTCLPILRQRIRVKVFPRDSFEVDGTGGSRPSGYVYPFGAVNEVMIADESFGKTFYAFIQIDNYQVYKVKCSGVLVTTGTGSTAWAYNISKLSINSITNIANLLAKNTDIVVSSETIRQTYDEYNHNLKFDPNDEMLKCIIREPIENKQGAQLDRMNENNCFMAKKIKIRALSRNPKLYLDGSKYINFNSGDTAILAAFSSDVIRSCL